MSKRVANRPGPSRNKGPAKHKLKRAMAKALNDQHRQWLLDQERERRAKQANAPKGPPAPEPFLGRVWQRVKRFGRS